MDKWLSLNKYVFVQVLEQLDISILKQANKKKKMGKRKEEPQHILTHVSHFK